MVMVHWSKTAVLGKRTGMGSSASMMGGSSVSEDVEAAVTEHLIRGNREAALEAAIGGKAWALALVIASVCGAEKYKEVVRLFADSDLTHGTPAHTLALVFGVRILERRILGAQPLLHSGPHHRLFCRRAVHIELRFPTV